MKNKTIKKIMVLTSASVALNLLLIGFLCFSYLFKQPTKHVPSTKKIGKNYRVAIFKPVSHPSLEQIEQGFVNTLNQESPLNISFTYYNANGDRSLMRSQAEDIVHNKYDLAFTIGAGCSKMVKEISTKKQLPLPIVFGAVADPVKMNIVASEKSSGNHVTGAKEGRDIPKQLALLMRLKPNLKRVLLVYNPAEDPQLEKDKQDVERILKNRNITFKALEVYQTNEILSKVKSQLNVERSARPEVLLILKDNTMVSSLDALLRLCNRYQITLYASDLDSPDKGAALGFGVPEYSFGIAGAKKARLILEEKQHPSAIPISPVSDYRLKINTSALEAQNLIIDKELLFIIKNGIVIT